MTSSNSSKLLPVTATVVACSLSALYCWLRRGERNKDGEETVVALLPVERVLASGGGGDNAMSMSTLTWLHGDYSQIEEALRHRADSILKANPWLGGKIAKRNGAPALVYDAKIDLNHHFQVWPETSKILSREIPLDRLGSSLSKFLVKCGPLWKVHIFPCFQNPRDRFAVVFSMSHAIADGHTFYRIQNMLLSTQEEVESLQANRIVDTEQKQVEALGGKEECKFLQSPAFIVNCVYGVLSSLFNRTETVSRIYLVDTKGMEATKHSAVEGTDLSFVSSNDVLTSWFLQNSHCKHGLMALNFRNRLEGHTESHAGNYENVIFYRPPDSASPALIRKSILPETRQYMRHITRNEPMPGFWTVAGGSVAIATNWASFAKPCLIEGCQQDVHIPLYNLSDMLPSSLALLLIFRSGRGLAVLVAGSKKKVADLEREVPFLCNQPLSS